MFLAFLILGIILICAIIEDKKISKAGSIIASTRPELVANHKKAYEDALTRLFVFLIIVSLGVIIYLTADLQKTVSVKTWLFGEVSRVRWTGAHYCAFFCTVFGGLCALIVGIKAKNNYSEMKSFEKMTDSEFEVFKEKARIEKEQKEKEMADTAKAMKQANRGLKIGRFLGSLLFG
ncbi:MAG: hypothetical protein IKX67_10220 [Bacteroidales bacterium]|nr:hypothetical protein [Bacteroidales bacterium]